MTVEERIRELREQLKDELFLAPKVTRALLDVVEAAAAYRREIPPGRDSAMWSAADALDAALARAGEPEA